MDEIKLVFSHIKQYRVQAVLAPAFKMAEALLELFVPIVVAAMIDVGIAGGDAGYIRGCTAVLLLLAAGGVVLSVTAQYFSAVCASGFSASLRSLLMGKISRLSFSSLDKLGTSRLITGMTSDVNQVQSGVNLTLRLLLRSPFIILGSLVMSFFINIRLSAVMCVVIPCIALVIFLIMRKNLKGYDNVQKNVDNLIMRTRQNADGVRVVRAFGREDEFRREFESCNAGLMKSQLGTGYISGLLGPVTLVIIDLGICAVLMKGAGGVYSGTVSQGEVVALVNYMAAILVEMIKFADLIVNITRALACAKRIGGVLEESDERASGGEKPGIDKKMNVVAELDDVTFRYNKNAKPAVEHLNVRIGRGERFGVTGTTGSGKSTFAAMLGGFLVPDEGEIRVFGESVSKVDPGELRGRMAFCMQKPTLFSGTVAENLKMANAAASDEDMADALRLSCAYDFVKEKGGADACVEQNGLNFSGGQRARLAVARALLRKPDILILDDSYAAMDYSTQRRVTKNIGKLADEIGMTVITISQRVAPIMECDRIAVFENGRIIGCDTHEELLKNCGEYARICASQGICPDEGGER